MFLTQRGYPLWTQTFTSNNPPRAVLVFHHGYSEHFSRHAKFLQMLCDVLDITVMAFDMHGHGRSPPHEKDKRTYINKPEDPIDDLRSFVQTILRKTKLPLFLCGYSLGATIAINVAHMQDLPLAGLILISPLITVLSKQKLKRTVLFAVSSLLPRYAIVARKEPESIWREATHIAEYEQDTMFYKQPIQARSVRSIMKLCDRIDPKSIKIPLLIQHGTCDMRCPIDESRHFFESCVAKDKTFIELPGAYHDLTHDPCYHEFFENVCCWLEKKISNV